MFKSIYTTIITNIQKSLGKGSDWIINSVINHTISTSKHNSLDGSSYMNLLKQLDQPRKYWLLFKILMMILINALSGV